MLLFLIGLEVRPQRLWVMRRAVFGLGTAQVVITARRWRRSRMRRRRLAGRGRARRRPGAVVHRDRAADAGRARPAHQPAGRDAFAVLLFQDLAFIPLVALVPLLAGDALPDHVPWHRRGTRGGRDRRHPGRRPLPDARRCSAPSAARRRRRCSPPSRCSSSPAPPRSPPSRACRCRSAPSWPACCCRNPNTATSCRPTSSRSRACCSASSSSRSACRPICRWPRRSRRCSSRRRRHCCWPRRSIAFALARIAGRAHANALRFGLALPQASEFSFVLFGAAVAAGALGEGDAAFATLVTAASMVATPILFAGAEAGCCRG